MSPEAIVICVIVFFVHEVTVQFRIRNTRYELRELADDFKNVGDVREQINLLRTELEQCSLINRRIVTRSGGYSYSSHMPKYPIVEYFTALLNHLGLSIRKEEKEEKTVVKLKTEKEEKVTSGYSRINEELNKKFPEMTITASSNADTYQYRVTLHEQSGTATPIGKSKEASGKNSKKRVAKRRR